MSFRDNQANQLKSSAFRIDKDLADDTEAVLSELGLNPTTAINMFYKRIVANGALPFNASL
ncbi:type II toxin-antitoxin system RelB/DinJ family antitoxin, partial [Lactobacillus helveticus]